MEKIEVTRLSSKGQVVLPQAVRRKLHLIKGERFVVVANGDTIVLKKLEIPSLASAQALVYKSRAMAKKTGLSLRHIKQVIHKVRASQ